MFNGGKQALGQKQRHWYDESFFTTWHSVGGYNVTVNLKYNDISLMFYVANAGMVGIKEHLFVIVE